MNTSALVGRWLGYGDVAQIERWRPAFGAAWARETPLLLIAALAAVVGLTVWFYTRWQAPTPRSVRWTLAGLRSVALCCLVLMLADPILELTFTRHPQPVLWLALDSSESLSLVDDAAAREPSESVAANAGPRRGLSRSEQVQAFLRRNDAAWLRKLAERFRVRVFAVTGKELTATLTDDATTDDWLDDWTCTGQVTALGDALDELARRQGGDNLAGVVLISDFDQNAGASPLVTARRLSAPIFTIGVGPITAVDLAVDLLTPPTMKKAETSTLVVTLRQRELEQASVVVRVFATARPGATSEAARIPVGEKTVTLSAATQTVEFSHTPDHSGLFTFFAEVDPLPGETVTQNNRAERDVRIIDDFLRLLFVEYEPTWEWRFIKEVFHRDKLVGLRGFRTFLRSADPVVREQNDLFLHSLTLPRKEFFEVDVIFLGDMPATALNPRFCDMVKEFVDQFGGGLVVIAGPRFGPGQLAQTSLADLLPVVVDPAAKIRDQSEFRLQLTPLAAQYDFMRLGHSVDNPLKGWTALGKLPWYQPVLRVDPRATVLAEHPTALCADGRTKQPLIAIRPYGRGEVVYVGFNEMWRLRRLHGEEYYRQFWGQLIHRLGLSHALGDQKRFVVRTDKSHYRRGETALVTVEAYNADFEPLLESDVPEQRLSGTLLRPEPDDQGQREFSIAVPQLRAGLFEARLPLPVQGEYRLRVTDPVTAADSEISFAVADVSIELRNPVRNVALQEALAAETGGRSYDLSTADKFLDDFHPPRPRETMVETIPLWSNWFTFALITLLLWGEWSLRKWKHLT
uniref:Glutamine amidotransferase domain-containing protein n=1 Tax=Schlesneria paludicola TaxID=360056 RepID=A0A7C4LL15_9PLAN